MKKNENVKNVYELAQETFGCTFLGVWQCYVSFSGGKDSGVLLNLCIDYIRRNNLKIKLGVFFMDYEVQYDHTIAFINRILKIIRTYWGISDLCSLLKWEPVLPCTSITGVHGMRPIVTFGYWEMPEGAMKAEDFTFFMTTCGIMSFQLRFACLVAW